MSDDRLREVFLGRQPILDREQATIGYELLFRAGHENQANVQSGRKATADVVCKAFAELGLAGALCGQRAFINVDADFLLDDALELLPAETVVLEFDFATVAAPGIADRCKELKADGYEISLAVDGASIGNRPPILDLASYLRIDVDALEQPALVDVARNMRSPGHKLIASHVESRAAMDACKTLGFDYFQGYYFAKPTIIEGRKLDASTQGLIRLINLLNEDVDVAKLEAGFKAEPALSVNLLRLTNSVGMGLPVRVESVRHAITLVGRKQLGRWLQLLLFTCAGAHIATNPLMQWAALRGCFMELLAGRCNPGSRTMRDQAFITGIMSLMPIALGQPMDDILAQIALTPDVQSALARHDGQLGMLLEMTERYDQNDMAGTAAVFPYVGGKLTMQSLNLCLAEAIAWVQQLCNEAR